MNDIICTLVLYEDGCRKTIFYLMCIKSRGVKGESWTYFGMREFGRKWTTSKEKYVRVIHLSSLIKIVCTLNIKMESFLMQILTGKDIGSTRPVQHIRCTLSIFTLNSKLIKSALATFALNTIE